MSRREMDARVIVDVNQTKQTFCGFEHLATLQVGAPPQVVYVGMCKLGDVFGLPEARRNTEWIRMFGNGNVQVMVRIMVTSSDPSEVRRYLIDHIGRMSEKPICNVRGLNLKSGAVPIRCSNGRLYQSQKDAAHDLGIAQSSISRHLRGDLGRVGDYTFWYEAESAEMV